MAMALAQRNTALPLPERIVALINEVRWLALGAVGVYLALILWGFDPADPGWSHAVAAERIANPGGRFGAWLADLLLYLFGLSAWWWVGLVFFLVAWGYRRLNVIFGGDRRPLTIAVAPFFGVSTETIAKASSSGSLSLTAASMITDSFGLTAERSVFATGL